MKVLFCLRRHLLAYFFVFLNLVGGATTRAQCYFLPPSGPMAFGFHEVGRYERVTAAGDSPMWMDDGRIIIGSDENGGAGYRRGAIYVFPKLNSTLFETE